MKKLSSAMILAFLALLAQRADAAPTDPKPAPAGGTWVIEGTLTKVTVTDISLQEAASTDVALELTFSTQGTMCDATINAGSAVILYRSNHPNAFDSWVRTAQSAYLSGRTLKYVTAKRATGTQCYSWYLQLK